MSTSIEREEITSGCECVTFGSQLKGARKAVMANEEHLAILNQGVIAWNEWRSENYDIEPNLRQADLCWVDLSGANFRRATLSNAEFRGADLSGADLFRAKLVEADLYGADLSGAGLIEADLREADLRGADLNAADLSRADLSRADLSRANLEEVTLFDTTLISVDLSPFVNVPINQLSPSNIDHRSIARSLHCENLLSFLVATGMNHIFATYAIDALRSLDPNGLFNLMHSTFISYGGPDEPFAIKLREALQTNGVTSFLFKKDAVPGQAISDVMRDQVREKDRIVVICSEASLDRPGVLNEMELTLRREAKEGGHTLLIPVAIDDYAHKGWAPKNDNLKDAILERVIADFQGADTDQTKFDAGLSRLLKALEIKARPESG